MRTIEKQVLEERLMQLAKEENILSINVNTCEEAIYLIEKYKNIIRECYLPEKYYEKLK